MLLGSSVKKAKAPIEWSYDSKKDMDKKTEPASITTTIYSGSINDFDLSSSPQLLKKLEQKNMDQLFRKGNPSTNHQNDVILDKQCKNSR